MQKTIPTRRSSVEPDPNCLVSTGCLIGEHKYSVKIYSSNSKCQFVVWRRGETWKHQMWSKQALRWIQIASGKHFNSLATVTPKHALTLCELLRTQSGKVIVDESLIASRGAN